MLEMRTAKSNTKQLPAVVGLILALGAPVVWVLAGSDVLRRLIAPSYHTAADELFYWLLAAVVVILALTWERRSLHSLGCKGLGWKDLLLAVGISIGAFILVPIVLILLQKVLGISAQTGNVLEGIAGMPFAARLLIALRAGVTEELLFRACPIESADRLTGKPWAGAVLGVAVFTLLHLPGWGVAHTLGVVLPLAVLFACVYLWWRNLTLNILTHFLVDFIPLVLVPLLPPLPV